MLPRRLAFAAAVAVLAWISTAHAQNPITIGFGMALTGGLAPNGKAALLAMQIWENDLNAKGGLLGRPVNEVQFQNVKANDVEQFKDPKTEVILWPLELKTGDLMYPYTDTQQ